MLSNTQKQRLNEGNTEAQGGKSDLKASRWTSWDLILKEPGSKSLCSSTLLKIKLWKRQGPGCKQQKTTLADPGHKGVLRQHVEMKRRLEN